MVDSRPVIGSLTACFNLASIAAVVDTKEYFEETEIADCLMIS